MENVVGSVFMSQYFGGMGRECKDAKDRVKIALTLGLAPSNIAAAKATFY